MGGTPCTSTARRAVTKLLHGVFSQAPCCASSAAVMCSHIARALYVSVAAVWLMTHKLHVRSSMPSTGATAATWQSLYVSCRQDHTHGPVILPVPA